VISIGGAGRRVVIFLQKVYKIVKMEQLLGGQPMLIFTSDVWVTIDISYLSLTVMLVEAFQFGSGSIKMDIRCTTVHNGGLVSLK
jgi:hypothetical protein